MAGPMQGIRVLEIGGIGPVPFCGMLFADMGAEIATVIPPKAKALHGPLPIEKDAVMRGRSLIRLDLKDPSAIDAMLELVDKADVLMEGFRPGVAERLGLGPDVCLSRNPRLVYGRMTGFGQTGPMAHAVGHDPNYLALTGALHAMGYDDRPPLPPLNLVGDFGGGGAYLAIGVLAALLHSRQTGEGQIVDAAMVDGAASLMTSVFSMAGAGLWRRERYSNILDGSAPFATCYETSDGAYMAVCAVEPPFYANFLAGLGLDPASVLARDDKANWPALRELFAHVFHQRTRDHWAAVFLGLDACVTPVLELGEAAAHHHMSARGVFVERDGSTIPAPAPRFSRTPSELAPQDGSRPADTLARWKLSSGTIERLQ